jgi:hypothetical protein
MKVLYMIHDISIYSRSGSVGICIKELYGPTPTSLKTRTINLYVELGIRPVILTSRFVSPLTNFCCVPLSPGP